MGTLTRLAAHDICTKDAERHLNIVGFPMGTAVILFLWADEYAAHKYAAHIPIWSHEEGRTCNWKLAGEWCNREHAKGRYWEHPISMLQKNGGSLGFRGSPGGTKAHEMLEMRFLIYEIDSRAVSVEEQKETWLHAGLPEPTLMVFTDNKSVHIYYVLDKPCGVEEGIRARERLNAQVNGYLAKTYSAEVTTDKNMVNAHQPVRLAGSVRPETGQRAEIVGGCEKRYALEDILQCCPEVEVTKTNRAALADIGGSGREFSIRPLPDDEVEDPKEQFPSGKDIPPIPIELTVDTKTKQLLTEGMDPEDDDRWRTYHRLAKHLIAGRLQAESLGYTVEGGEDAILERLDKFAVLSEMKGGDVDLVREKHYRPDEPCDETDLCNLYVRKAIRTWAEDNGHWRPTYNLQQRGSWKKSLDSRHWELTDTNTAETIVAEAFRLQGEATGERLTNYQGRFLKYDPQRGCFIPVSRSQLQREIATQMLPLIYQKKQNRKEYKQTKAHIAKGCVEWLEQNHHEEVMDVVPAIAFRNGTYIIKTGELVEHSPAFKLTFSIPGDYIPNAECPPVMHKYLENSFGTAWIGIIRCILRYLVDKTTFKPHKFVVVIGKSGSGKGVFERLCCEMFPPTCISAIAGGVNAISSAEKQRQLVTGKKLITFPDMQGHQTDVSALYALTDGGLMSSRALYSSETDAVPFTGRVVICSTQALNMENAGNGMVRRMLTLPTQGSAET